ncbi:DMT family transporter [Microbulbifer sediminum]|uniref:DMT family transporter n=1 Tax=Microbulbifer sediminum TaxID=2904250 RepID=UPI001F3ACD66|nr:DMT family transporter [Microbulbifer sediminum]
MMESNWRIGLPLALITAFMWALLPIALKGLLDEISATTATWFRFAGAAVLAGGYYQWKRRLNLRQLFQRSLLPLTLLAVAGLLTNYLSYASGLRFITPGAAQIVIQLAPLLLLTSSVIWLGEHFSPRQWLGVLMVLVGLPLFFNQRLPELLRGEDADYLLGLALFVLAAVGWAVYGFFQKKILSRARAQDLLVLIYIAGTLCFLPGADPLSVTGLDPVQWALLLFLTVNTLVAYGAFTKALGNWEASRVSATLALVPLMTLLIGSAIGTVWPDYIEVETLNWVSWVGAGVVVCGSLFAAIGRGR